MRGYWGNFLLAGSALVIVMYGMKTLGGGK